MTKEEIAPKLRHTGGLFGEFIFVVAMLFGSLGIVVVLLIGPNALQTPGLLVFATVLTIWAIHHFWYARNRNAIESSHEQKAIRERRGF